MLASIQRKQWSGWEEKILEGVMVNVKEIFLLFTFLLSTMIMSNYVKKTRINFDLKILS